MTEEECAHPTMLEYASEQLAENGATLHGWAFDCLSVRAFGCVGHWHVGHVTTAEAIACREEREARAAVRLDDKRRRYVTGPHGPRAASTVQNRPTRSREL